MTPRARGTTVEAPKPSGPRVRGIGLSGAPVEIQWDVRSAYDFVMSLSHEIGQTEDLPATDRRWLTEAKASLAEELGGADQVDDDLALAAAALVVDRPEVRTARDLVELLRSVDPMEMRRLLLSESLRDPSCREAAERLMGGDESAVDDLLKDASPEHAAKFRGMITRPADAQAAATRILEAWLPHFEEIEGRVAAMQRRDVEDRAADVESLEVGELIEKTTGGIRWVSDPGVRRVVLIPSYFSRPYNITLVADDWRLFAYPIADSALDGGDPDAPPQRLVRLNRALGDESRLRILRMLRDRDLYLTEIAHGLELSKPTAKHHLAQLRAAGLITMTEEGGYTYYSLRRERVREATVDLERYLA
jgi:DNA-binding transcriptional ArsR family regulator